MMLASAPVMSSLPPDSVLDQTSESKEPFSAAALKKTTLCGSAAALTAGTITDVRTISSASRVTETDLNLERNFLLIYITSVSKNTWNMINAHGWYYQNATPAFGPRGGSPKNPWP